MERTFGWRHFRVTQKRREGKEAFVLMVSTCDETTQFWVSHGTSDPAVKLGERRLHAPGIDLR